jgi:hypothetical protein
MRPYQATALIDSAPEQVWRVLTDTAAWPDWNSGVTKVDGQLALGEKLSITVEANPGRAFPGKVVTLEEPELIVFRGGMPLGLFTGKRMYTLKSETSQTRFRDAGAVHRAARRRDLQIDPRPRTVLPTVRRRTQATSRSESAVARQAALRTTPRNELRASAPPR